MEQNAKRRTGARGRAALVALLLALAVAWRANDASGALRLTWVPLHRLAVALGLALPWAALAVVRGAPRSRGRTLASVLVGTFAALSLAAAARALAGRAGPVSVQRLSVTATGRYDLVLSRVACGARCADAVVLEQRWRVLPGLVRVREVGRWQPARRATLTPDGPHAVWVTVPPYSPVQPSTAAEQRIVLDPSPFSAP